MYLRSAFARANVSAENVTTELFACALRASRGSGRRDDSSSRRPIFAASIPSREPTADDATASLEGRFQPCTAAYARASPRRLHRRADADVLTRRQETSLTYPE